MTETPLARVLGLADLDDPVPLACSARWTGASRLLRDALRDVGTHTRIRTPTRLWALLHPGPLPARLTWQLLLGEATVGQLAAAVAPLDQAATARIACWNLRSTRALHTTKNETKRGVVHAWLRAGRTVLLQETHWLDGDQDAQASLFQACDVHSSSPPRLGSGQAGGVAIIVPAPGSITQEHVLVPGYAIAADVKTPGLTYRAVSIYLPPDRASQMAAELRRSLLALPAGPPVYAGGDFNIDLLAPRPGEDQAAHLLLDVFRRLSCTVSPGPRVTCVSHGGSRVDHLLVPCGLAGRSRAHPRWVTGLSDHAGLSLNCTSAGTAARTLTPASFRLLPQAALDELRLCYQTLERTFDVPALDMSGVVPLPLTVPYPDPGILPEAHPGHGATGGPPRPPHDPGASAAPPEDAPRPAPQDDDGPPVPHLPRLQAYGRIALSASIKSWWARWCRRSRPEDLAGPLLEAARTDTSVTPDGALADWLRAYGWDGSPISPEDAACWADAWRHEQHQATLTAAPARARGPTARRAPLARTWAIGRRLFKRLHRVTTLRRPDGTATSLGQEIDEALWESRADIWCSLPASPAFGERVLDAYFRERGPSPPVELPLAWRRLASTVLGPGGSAPGLDGEPYEVYHYGVRFVSALLGQALHAAQDHPDLLDVVLGPSIDLLAWIPKVPGADQVHTLRPLQLPPCFRRLYGTVLARAVEPVVGPLLTRDQAAILGGHCGDNIRRVFDHLESGPAPPRPGGDLWRDIFGDLADTMEAFVAKVPECGLSQEPAVFLADQNKAFERIALAWVDAVLRRWAFPRWVTRSFLALVAARAVRACRDGRPGPLRHLLRSIGMGGTASPLTWVLAYDPIVFAVQAATGAEAPTYVDDLSALTRGPRQTMRVMLTLPWLSLAAGLQVTTHSCEWLVLPSAPDSAEAFCARLPVRTRRIGATLSVAGLPIPLLRHLLSHGLGPAVVDLAWNQEDRCACSLKSALVPCRRVPSWRQALVCSPFGPGTIVEQYPYLGSQVVSRDAQQAPAERRRLRRHLSGWTPAALAHLRALTWRKPCTGMIDRGNRAAEAGGSPGLLAAMWNGYGVSMVPYVAHIIPPGRPEEAALERGLLRMVRPGAHWCPARAITGMGCWWRVPGSPRCPIAAAHAVGALAAAQAGVRAPPRVAPAPGQRAWGHGPGGGWGPRQARQEQRDRLQACVAWAGRRPDDPLGRQAGRVMGPLQAAEILRAYSTPLGRPDPTEPLPPRLGQALYVACWALHHQRPMERWARLRDTERSWAPWTGREWRVLGACPHFTAGYHVLRLLNNGLPGGARWRSHDERPSILCQVCQQPAHHVWRTGRAQQSPVAWCAGCFHNWRAGDAWASLPANLLPADLRAYAVLRRGARTPLDADWGASAWGCCPLCGLGEAGSEHLLCWCPAVALSWLLLRPDAAPQVVWDALSSGDWADALCRFLHQVSFLYNTRLDSPPLGALGTVQFLRRALLARPSADLDVGEDDGAPDDDEFVSSAPRHRFAAWSAPQDCGTCVAAAQQAANVRRTAVPQGRRRGQPDRIVQAACRHPTPRQGVIAVLTSPASPAAWLAPGPGWWPRPTVSPLQSCNAYWQVETCSACQHCRATLRASRALLAGSILRVPVNPSPPGEAALCPFELTYDGATGAGPDGRLVAGAACIWERPSDGRAPQLRATVRILLPLGATAQDGEAQACRIGLEEVARLDVSRRRLRVIGDCPPVTRYGAAQGRLQRLPAQAAMDAGIRAATSRGWRLTWALVHKSGNQTAHAAARSVIAQELRHPGFYVPGRVTTHH